MPLDRHKDCSMNTFNILFFTSAYTTLTQIKPVEILYDTNLIFTFLCGDIEWIHTASKKNSYCSKNEI